jgi:hypothetical protein
VTGSPIPFSTFGGQLKSDNSYRFNISRHVQAIVTRKQSNNILRLSAPLIADVFVSNLGQKVNFEVLDRIAEGRVVLGGGNFADPSLSMRLHIIYSKL